MADIKKAFQSVIRKSRSCQCPADWQASCNPTSCLKGSIEADKLACYLSCLWIWVVHICAGIWNVLYIMLYWHLGRLWEIRWCIIFGNWGITILWWYWRLSVWLVKKVDTNLLDWMVVVVGEVQLVACLKPWLVNPKHLWQEWLGCGENHPSPVLISCEASPSCWPEDPVLPWWCHLPVKLKEIQHLLWLSREDCKFQRLDFLVCRRIRGIIWCSASLFWKFSNL